MTFTTLGDATAISTILSNTNTLSDIHTDIAHNHTDISTMQGNVTTILGTTNTLSDIHTDVGSAIADIAAVHTHVHSLPTSFVTSGAASVQRGNYTFGSYGSFECDISISPINMSKSFITLFVHGAETPIIFAGWLLNSSTLRIRADSAASYACFYWEVITFA